MKKRRRSRAFLYSFTGTLLALVLLFLVVYETPPSQVSTETVPSTLPTYSAPWGPFVPAIALQMGFENFTMINNANQSILLGTRVLLNLTNPSAVILNSDLKYHLDVAVVTPNSTYDVLFLKPSSYAHVSSQFTAKGHTQDGGAASLYNITEISGGLQQLGWVGLFPGQYAVAFSGGQISGEQTLDIAFDTYNSTISQMISFTSIPSLLYTIGGASGHFAIGIQNFPGLVYTGLLTLISVDSLPGYVQTSYVVQFANQGIAVAQVQTMRTDYRDSHDFTVYQPSADVKAVVLTKSAALEVAVQQVG